MKVLRHRALRIVAAIFFAALLLVPLLESGHNHGPRDLAKPCAVCVATHHAPAVAAPVIAVAPCALRATFTVLALASTPLERQHSPNAGRAPPRALSSTVA